jgi:hypothetical protein
MHTKLFRDDGVQRRAAKQLTTARVKTSDSSVFQRCESFPATSGLARAGSLSGGAASGVTAKTVGTACGESC